MTCEIFAFHEWKQIALNFSHRKALGANFFLGNLATGHFTGKMFFDGHSSGQTGPNDIGLKFLSFLGAEKMGGHTHTDFGYYIYRLCRNFLYKTIGGVAFSLIILVI